MTKTKRTKVKKKWSELSRKEQAKKQRSVRSSIAVAEASVAVYDSMALPTKKLRRTQENYIRKKYIAFNKIRQKVHLPIKSYKRLHSKGEVEVIK